MKYEPVTICMELCQPCLDSLKPIHGVQEVGRELYYDPEHKDYDPAELPNPGGPTCSGCFDIEHNLLAVANVHLSVASDRIHWLATLGMIKLCKQKGEDEYKEASLKRINLCDSCWRDHEELVINYNRELVVGPTPIIGLRPCKLCGCPAECSVERDEAAIKEHGHGYLPTLRYL